jgi:hypothetical protein
MKLRPRVLQPRPIENDVHKPIRAQQKNGKSCRLDAIVAFKVIGDGRTYSRSTARRRDAFLSRLSAARFRSCRQPRKYCAGVVAVAVTVVFSPRALPRASAAFRWECRSSAMAKLLAAANCTPSPGELRDPGRTCLAARSTPALNSPLGSASHPPRIHADEGSRRYAAPARHQIDRVSLRRHRYRR